MVEDGIVAAILENDGADADRLDPSLSGIGRPVV
jgi:hypothetical protein